MAAFDRTKLDKLISAHRAAHKAFTVICERHDLEEGSEIEPDDDEEREYDRLDRAETLRRRWQILSHRPQSLEECGLRARYVLQAKTILDALHTDPDFLDIFLKSFLPDA